MSELKIGIIGTGHLGRLHTKLFKEVQNCKLIGIYDQDSERAKACGNEFNVSVFSDLNELLSRIGFPFSLLV